MAQIIKNRMFEEQGVSYSILGLTERDMLDLKGIMNQARIYAADPDRCKFEEWSDSILKLYFKLEEAWINQTEIF